MRHAEMKTKIRTAVVLVGGSGLRMRPYTDDMPKCMIPLHGEPLLFWTIEWLKKYGFNHIVLGVAHRKEVIINYIRENPPGLRVDFSEHTQEGETGEGFRLAIQRHVSDDNFLAMNGDELTNLNLDRFAAFHVSHGTVATIAVSPMRSPFGILEIEGDDVRGFKEKPLLDDKLVSTGIYIFNNAIKNYLPERGAIEKTTFPLLAKKKLLKAFRLDKKEKWFTVNSVKDLSVAEEGFESMMGLEK